MIKRISPAELKAMLSDGGELGLFDVREEGTFSASHLFYAAPMPLSRLEILGPRLAPRRNVRMVLVDDASGLVERAAAILTQQLDYCDVSILDGGIAGWQAAGYELFSGVHVPSKAFGEFVEVNYDTPHIDAQALKAMQDAGEDLVVLDSRPVDEYRNMNIPGGIDCPGAELVYRVSEIAASAGHKSRGQLRRPHAQHHRRSIADQCSDPKPSGGAEEWHHGLASGRFRVGTRPGPHGTGCVAGRAG